MHNPKKEEQLDLEVRHYGTATEDFVHYDDDDETLDYENAAYSFTKLSTNTSEGNQKGKVGRESGTIFNYRTVYWKFMTKCTRLISE